jgi:hypothetical protein
MAKVVDEQNANDPALQANGRRLSKAERGFRRAKALVFDNPTAAQWLHGAATTFASGHVQGLSALETP